VVFTPEISNKWRLIAWSAVRASLRAAVPTPRAPVNHAAHHELIVSHDDQRPALAARPLPPCCAPALHQLRDCGSLSHTAAAAAQC
jgi:hypothetical protein